MSPFTAWNIIKRLAQTIVMFYVIVIGIFPKRRSTVVADFFRKSESFSYLAARPGRRCTCNLRKYRQAVQAGSPRTDLY